MHQAPHADASPRPPLGLFPAGTADADGKTNADSDSGAGDGDDSAGGWKETDSFRQFVSEHWWTQRRMHKKNPRTQAEYRASLDLFCTFLAEPRLGEISNARLARFLDWLEDGSRQRSRPGLSKTEGLATATVKKHLRQLGPMIEALGPPHRHNKAGIGLYSSVPFFPDVEGRDPPQRAAYSEAEIGLLFKNVSAATQPKVQGVRTRDLWTWLFTLLNETAVRITPAVSLEFAWLAEPAAGQSGRWVRLPGAESGNKFAKDLELYLNRRCVEALERVTTKRARVKIFPWVLHRRSLDLQLRRIEEAAGIPHLPERSWHGIRRAALTRLSPEEARIVAGHSSVETTIKHYIGRERLAQIMDREAER